MDDILVFGSNPKEHDKRLKAALERLESAGVTLNPKKCEFSKSSLKFLGHVINKDGISADPEKVRAITVLPPPTNIPELRRIMGMINQLGKFLPSRAKVTRPMTALLSPKNACLAVHNALGFTPSLSRISYSSPMVPNPLKCWEIHLELGC